MENELTRQQKIWLFGKTFWKALKPLLLYIFMPAASMAVGYVIGHSDMTVEEFFLYGGNFYTAVGMVLTLYILYRSSKKKGSGFCKDAGLYIKREDAKKAALFFVFGIFASLTVSSCLSILPDWAVVRDYTEASQNMFKGRDILFTLITTVITAPLAEEIVFRGYMLNTFLEKYDEKKSILIISLIFAVSHGEWLWIIYAFIMGALLAWVSVREDNIVFGIAMHMGFNLPSGITWLIYANENLSDLFFAGKWMYLLYGLTGFLVCFILGRKYLEGRK